MDRYTGIKPDRKTYCVTSAHRIITPACRERGDELVMEEALESARKAIRSAYGHWSKESGTRIHVKVEVEYSVGNTPDAG